MDKFFKVNMETRQKNVLGRSKNQRFGKLFMYRLLLHDNIFNYT